VAQQLSSPQNLPTDYGDRVILFPTREAASVPVKVPAQSTSRPATARKVRARRRVIRQVVVLEVAGRLSDVGEDLDREIQLALADGARGVVCDLSAMPEGAEPVAVESLATAGRHVRDWPGIPIAVACPDPRVREALAAHPLGGHLIVTAALFTAVSAVLATPTLSVESLRLAPHPTAPRAAREFITRTLLDWRLGRVIPLASQLTSELVATSSNDAGTDIDLSIAWNLGALRLTVGDHGPALPGQRPTPLHSQERRLAVVAGLSRAFGVLRTADGGKVVWAVLDAPRPRPPTRRNRSGRATDRQDSPIFTDGRGLAELPFCAGPSRPPTSDAIRPPQAIDPTFAPVKVLAHIHSMWPL